MEFKLIECPACGNEVSSQAAACPKCGHPLAQEAALGVQPNQAESPPDNQSSIKMVLCAILIVVMIIFSAINVDPLLRLIVGVILCVIAFSNKGKRRDPEEKSRSCAHPEKTYSKEADYLGKIALLSMLIGIFILPIVFGLVATFLGLLAVKKGNKLGWWGLVVGGLEMIYFVYACS